MYLRRCQLLEFKCERSVKSASQPASYSKSHEWDVVAKNPENFPIWPYYCTRRSYLRSKFMNEVKYFASVI